MKKEIWKDIPGYEGLYKISNLGNVYSVRNKKCLSKSKRTTYSLVCLSKCGKHECFHVHRLVAIAFIPNPENKPQVNHINCNRHDNRVENLEWVTLDENYMHYWNSEKFQRIHKAPQRYYFVKDGCTEEYNLIRGTGTSQNIVTGEVVKNRVLTDSGYKIHCEILTDYWEEK
jgi:hypothetical protein